MAPTIEEAYMDRGMSADFIGPIPTGPPVILPTLFPIAPVAPFEGDGDAWRRIADEMTPLIVKRAARANAVRLAWEAAQIEAEEKAFEKAIKDFVEQIVKDAVEVKKAKQVAEAAEAEKAKKSAEAEAANKEATNKEAINKEAAVQDVIP